MARGEDGDVGLFKNILFILVRKPSFLSNNLLEKHQSLHIHTHPQSETDDSHEKIDDIGNDHADDDDLKIKPPVSLKLKLIQVGKTVQSWNKFVNDEYYLKSSPKINVLNKIDKLYYLNLKLN